MAKARLRSLGAMLIVGGLLAGCTAPEGDKPSVTTVQGAVTSPLFNPYVTYPSGSSPVFAAIGDLNNDGRSDVAVTAGPGSDPANDNAVHVFLQAADGTLGPGVVYSLGTWPSFIEIGDLNGDGRADLVVTISGGIGVMLQNASGTLDSMVAYSVTAGIGPIKVGDFNGDGRLDVAEVNSNSVGNNLSIFLQTATGTLASPVALPGARWRARAPRRRRQQRRSHRSGRQGGREPEHLAAERRRHDGSTDALLGDRLLRQWIHPG